MTRAALLGAGGRAVAGAVPESVALLVKGALRTMILDRLKPPGLGLSAFGLLAAGAVALGGASEPPAEVVLKAGPLTLEVRIARTAHLFHVVDQLAAWSPFCHAQYRRHFEADGGFSDQDLTLLAAHADLRKSKGWGAGLEQTFYTGRNLEDALKEGVARGHLTAEQAAIERVVLGYFAARVDRLLGEQIKTLEAFRARLAGQGKTLASFAEETSRFVGGARPSVPVYLIANPSEDSIGGGYNGGRLTLEVPTRRDAYPSFLHEVFHAFLETQRPAMRKAVRGVKGLDEETLNEGLAYALSPGIIRADDGSADPLRERVAADLKARKPMDDPYVRSNRYGLALRPLLGSALKDPDQTLETFLPRAIDAWRSLHELSAAWEGEPRRTRLFSFGPGWRVLGGRAAAMNSDLSSFNHLGEHYEKTLSEAAPGATLVLMIALDHTDRAVPDAYRDLLPRPLPEVEAVLAKGGTLELTGEARGMRTVLLAAPTQGGLETLIRKTTLIGPAR